MPIGRTGNLEFANQKNRSERTWSIGRSADRTNKKNAASRLPHYRLCVRHSLIGCFWSDSNGWIMWIACKLFTCLNACKCEFASIGSSRWPSAFGKLKYEAHAASLSQFVKFAWWKVRLPTITRQIGCRLLWKFEIHYTLVYFFISLSLQESARMSLT